MIKTSNAISDLKAVFHKLEKKDRYTISIDELRGAISNGTFNIRDLLKQNIIHVYCKHDCKSRIYNHAKYVSLSNTRTCEEIERLIDKIDESKLKTNYNDIEEFMNDIKIECDIIIKLKLKNN
jgi:hypothetical protein